MALALVHKQWPEILLTCWPQSLTAKLELQFWGCLISKIQILSWNLDLKSWPQILTSNLKPVTLNVNKILASNLDFESCLYTSNLQILPSNLDLNLVRSDPQILTSEIRPSERRARQAGQASQVSQASQTVKQEPSKPSAKQAKQAHKLIHGSEPRQANMRAEEMTQAKHLKSWPQIIILNLAPKSCLQILN